MRKTLKIIFGVLILGLVIYFIFGKNKNVDLIQTPEMTGGPAGERAEGGFNLETGADLSTDFGTI